ncbi:hypothetical protein ABPG75_001746 [Micractinium tetrahymenae]
MAPEPDEAGVKCYEGYLPDAKEMPCAAALGHRKEMTVPLSQCKDRCNMRGHCMKVKDEDRPAYCWCDRSFAGETCETEVNTCYKGCSGRGKCRDGFCHCEPPYFRYELNTQVAFEKARQPGGGTYDPHYLAYAHFLDQVLESPVRTENPNEAQMFFLPVFNMAYSGWGSFANRHLAAVIDHLTHFGYTATPDNEGPLKLGTKGKSSSVAKDDTYVDAIAGMSMDDMLRNKTRHGWGIRLVQAMLAGCVPVIIQEHVMQYYEDVLPYETFSIRLNNADLPHLRQLLRSITEQQYRRLLEGVLEHRLAFSWNKAKGGRAFDYTILSLRRKWLNLQSLYVGTYDRGPQ